VTEPSPAVVAVEIFGLRYPIRSTLPGDYVGKLADYVDAKMHAAAAEVPSGETVRVAVVAALNIADELFRQSEPRRRPDDEAGRRAASIERLLDIALAQED